jgi:antitoxin (DNA-binding transcriptional repressor) of toxin-antitoxin stability system
MIRVNIHDAKTNFSRYLSQVQAGEVILICNRNIPIAEIRAVTTAKHKPRPFGIYDGQGYIADDAFDPMTDEEVALWEKPIF